MNTIEAEKNEPLVSKRGVGIAGVAAFVGCVACCTIPLLAAAGLSGGALAGLSAVFKPGSELMIGGGVFLGTLAVIALRSRIARRATGNCGSACNVDRTCCNEHVS